MAQQKKIVDLENVVNTLKETVATSVQEILKQVTETVELYGTCTDE